MVFSHCSDVDMNREDGLPCTNKGGKEIEGGSNLELKEGLEFDSLDEAEEFYKVHAARVGFEVRIGKFYRSRDDGLVSQGFVTFVCSKEGYSRTGCKALIRVQKKMSGKWVIATVMTEHNHDLVPGGVIQRKVCPSLESSTTQGKRLSREHNHEPLDSQADETNDTINLNREHNRKLDSPADETNEKLDPPDGETNDQVDLSILDRQNNIGNDWYTLLLEYFQRRLMVDTGFFYAIQVNGGRCGSVFWADGRSRFYCSQFGDGIVFDTSYSRNTHLVPFAFFTGTNHHKQPVLLGCALIANESEECFTWVFQTWIRAMSGKHPMSIQANQDLAIQHSIAKVFPETHHLFTLWQMKENQEKHLGHLLSMNNFKCEYIHCISESQNPGEFESAWNLLLNKYHLEENVWLKEMYRMRKSWVSLYCKGTFFPGAKSFFGTLLIAQSPLNEFISHYETTIKQRLEEERKEDLNSVNTVTELLTKNPMEEHCRSHYTNAVFKSIQKELMECYGYVAKKISRDGKTNRYLVQKCVNGNIERNIVDINRLNLNVKCSCKLFESVGVLCRHALKIFNIMNIREIPSLYIIHRWTKRAKFGIIRDGDSCEGFQDLKNLMVWALREEACNYIEAGASSLENYKLAFFTMKEVEKTLCWPEP
ncbi:protein FAR1-RELATED SEQUENCE 12-like [Impatiens glandulifera]|uniref:protein FAR1-RELATED SEQUENCE 12-like n=1 Tax=Impatiens glandulifera TaxID=253017 RepID=UPI001FB0D3D0|nr:protein FAR1-RELATED SEQUENCE 12-like [Impatiens glandulifera]